LGVTVKLLNDDLTGTANTAKLSDDEWNLAGTVKLKTSCHVAKLWNMFKHVAVPTY
jgi:hypothetical protein